MWLCRWAPHLSYNTRCIHACYFATLVAGAEQKGSVAVALSIVAPGAPAGSELNDDVAPSQAWDAFDEFDL